MSTEPKWTPGEWQAMPEPSAQGLWMVVVEAGDLIADTTSHEPDAHLIAAAPQLYAALKAVEWRGSKRVGPDVDECCPTCEAYPEHGHAADCQLNAALRKARGET